MKRKALGGMALVVVLLIGATAWVWWATQFPIVSGEVASGTIWKDSADQSIEGGNPIEVGSRVRVYEGFILVITPEGERIIIPHGWYSELKLKPSPWHRSESR